MLDTTIGLYKILDEIGGGGFGTVHMARHQRTNEVVALKVLHAELSNRPDFIARFWQEAQALRALPPHPNIVGLRDFGEVQGQPYLVMDYLAGRDLPSLLADGPLPVRKATSIAAQVADALEAAARGGLIHCDIKPENLKVLPNGTVKVMDFGIARAADSNLREIAGTPAYMAPEQWRGQPPEPAIDVYALGCVLYEMLTGRQPFVSSNRSDKDKDRIRRELEQLHQTVEPDWSLLQGKAAPPELLAVLKGMLAKSPQDRPPASQVAAQLRQMERTIAPEARLPGAGIETATAIDDDATRPHIVPVPPLSYQEGDLDKDRTVLRPKPRTPSDYVVTTPPAPELERISTGVRVFVQRHLASLDLGAEACRAMLVHKLRAELFTGTVEGQVWRLNLRTGRSQCWDVVPRSAVRSPNWAFAVHRGRILLHTGNVEWTEIDAEGGQITRQGTLPEAGMRLITSGEWLYMSGAGKRLYRAPLRDLERRDEFDVDARLTGVPHVTHGAVFAPTSRGLVWLDTGSRCATPVGPRQTAHAVTPMYGDRTAVLYSAVVGGVQSSFVRVFDVSTLPPVMLAEAKIAGQSAGPIQVAGDRVVLACRDGCVWAWDAVRGAQRGDEWTLSSAWPRNVKVGPGVQSGTALGDGLLALAPCKDNAGVLVVLNATNGQMVFEHPLAGDVFVSPVWWERTLSVVVASGTVEVFRVTLVSDRATTDT